MGNISIRFTPEEIFTDENSAYKAGYLFGDEIALFYVTGCFAPDVDESERTIVDDFVHGLYHGAVDRFNKFEEMKQIGINETYDFIQLYLLFNYFMK